MQLPPLLTVENVAPETDGNAASATDENAASATDENAASADGNAASATDENADSTGRRTAASMTDENAAPATDENTASATDVTRLPQPTKMRLPRPTETRLPRPTGMWVPRPTEMRLPIPTKRGCRDRRKRGPRCRRKHGLGRRKWASNGDVRLATTAFFLLTYAATRNQIAKWARGVGTLLGQACHRFVFMDFLCDLEKWGKFFSSYKGKDKFARSIQYGSRFLCYHALEQDRNSWVGARCKVLHKNLSINRKAFRLFRWINDFRKARVAYYSTTEKNPIKKFLRICAELSYFVYALHDNCNWLRAINVTTVNHQRLKDRQTLFRLTAAWTDFWYHGIIVFENWRQQRTVQKASFALTAGNPGEVSESSAVKALSKELMKLRKKQYENWLNLFKFFLDVVTYIRNPLVKYYGKVHITIIGVRIGYTEGVQALAGFTAALIGVRSCWRKLDSVNVLKHETAKPLDKPFG
jgi:hypothetical protein